MAAVTQSIDAGVSRRSGACSHAHAIPGGAGRAFRSDTQAARPDETMPKDPAEGVGHGSDAVRKTPRRAGAEPSATIHVRPWPTDRDGIEADVRVRKAVISHRPAYMLTLVQQAIRSGLRREAADTAVVMQSAAEHHE
ncbi:hypothetical protein [Streptomyces fagopyri]|uniref:hypothetical protein n=1 Tax=Streptomyces fagopyri TaxID=2662397 RepID=UPI0033F98DA8